MISKFGQKNMGSIIWISINMKSIKVWVSINMGLIKVNLSLGFNKG